MIYIGFKICKKCGKCMDWGIKHCCPNCKCCEYEEDE